MNRELSVLIPVYNNRSTLQELITRVTQTCEKLCADAYEVILVDDGSVDDSWAIICAFDSPNVTGLKLSRNFGQHAALKASFVQASGRFMIMLDADLEDPPELIQDIYTQLKKDQFDICYTRLVAEKGQKTRWTSRLFQKVSQMLGTHTNIENIGTMRGFNEKVKAAILRYGERRPVYGPLITSLGFTYTFVDLALEGNKGRNSNYGFRKRLQLGIDHLIGYSKVASTFFLIASLASTLGTVTYAGTIIIQYLFFGNAMPPGISLLIVVILILFSILFFGIGIIGIYLQRVLDETLGRPLYVIAETSSSAKADHETNLWKANNVRRD